MNFQKGNYLFNELSLVCVGVLYEIGDFRDVGDFDLNFFLHEHFVCDLSEISLVKVFQLLRVFEAIQLLQNFFLT